MYVLYSACATTACSLCLHGLYLDTMILLFKYLLRSYTHTHTNLMVDTLILLVTTSSVNFVLVVCLQLLQLSGNLSRLISGMPLLKYSKFLIHRLFLLLLGGSEVVLSWMLDVV